ncbi:MAG: sugar transferase [Spirochaetales bacterium]|nr:sugar transferase [Spirochaetales bacterium]
MNRRLLKLFVAIVDYSLLQFSLFLVLYFRYGMENLMFQWIRHFQLFGFFALIWVLDFYIADIYNITQKLDYKRFIVSMTVNVGLSVSFFYVFPNIPITPKTNLGLIVAVYVVFFLGWRNILELFMDKLGIRRSLIFIGLDKHSLELAQKLMDTPRLGYTISGFVVGTEDFTSDKIPEWMKEGSIHLMHNMKDLYDYLENPGTHSIVVSENWYRDVYIHLYKLFPKGVRMYQLSTFWEKVVETIPVNATDELWFLQNMSRGPYTIYHKLKRFFDLSISLIFLPVFLSLGLFTAILVKVTSKGPAIYKQVRVGMGNRNFTIYKFRSMKVDAEKNGAVWASEKDPRLTLVGDFIRKVRLDELPQIFNVIKGDMSLIGPRPERPEFIEQLAEDIPHYNLRHLVKPGLTGWAQVKYRYGSSVEDSSVKLTYDLFYVKNISPILDLKITLKTILTILSKSGR